MVHVHNMKLNRLGFCKKENPGARLETHFLGGNANRSEKAEAIFESSLAELCIPRPATRTRCSRGPRRSTPGRRSCRRHASGHPSPSRSGRRRAPEPLSARRSQSAILEQAPKEFVETILRIVSNVKASLINIISYHFLLRHCNLGIALFEIHEFLRTEKSCECLRTFNRFTNVKRMLL